MSTSQPDRTRCGYLIQHSDNLYNGNPGMYRISRSGWSCYQTLSQLADLDALTDDDFEWLLFAWQKHAIPAPGMAER